MTLRKKSPETGGSGRRSACCEHGTKAGKYALSDMALPIIGSAPAGDASLRRAYHWSKFDSIPVKISRLA